MTDPLRGVLHFYSETGTEGGFWAFQDERFIGLEDGDHLTIFDRTEPERIVWEGVVSLGPFSVFEEDAFGMWIHNDQQGIDRETWARWFMEENPAILVPAR